jgi:ABC-type multidrug transport system fused ATPase/permease subunit
VTAGETLGIVGPSGAGKSTPQPGCALYDPDTGAIRFDNADLRDCRLGRAWSDRDGHL